MSGHTVSGTIGGVEDEVPLHGGSATVVVRRGETARRTAAAWTPSVRALSRHLRG